MYIERVPNRNSPPAVLLRESYREDGKVRKRTLANLSKLPDHAVNGLQALLKGGVTIASLPDSFKITRSRPHGHVAAVLGSLKNTGLHNLNDVSSSYFEGKTCPLARYGYNRDGKRGKLQIVFGLICDAEGCPIAIEVFEGNTADPTTLTNQMAKLKERFGIAKIIWVGDRGIISSTTIQKHFQSNEERGFDWISALRATQIRSLVEQESIQLSLFDEQNIAEISSDDYPGERLIACRNPMLAAERAKTREELLQATEKELSKIVAATTRQKKRLTGASNIALKVGKVVNRYKVAKHFTLDIQENSFSYKRNTQSINSEAALDGLYVIRTTVESAVLSPTETVRAYKSLSQVEQAFRSFKTVDLKVRPIYHRLGDRVKAHVFLCMLAYYVEYQMRSRLAPMLFDEDDWESAHQKQTSVVKAAKSDRTKAKARTKRTADNLPVHSFQTLLADLGTIAHNEIVGSIEGASWVFDKITQPTIVQQKALDLLGVALICTQ